MFHSDKCFKHFHTIARLYTKYWTCYQLFQLQQLENECGQYVGGAGKMALSVTCSTAGFSCQNFSCRVGEEQFLEELQLPIEFALVDVQTGR